jgi:hypothetical protein
MATAVVAVAGKRVEEELIHPAIGQDLGAPPRRDGQHHVEGDELAVELRV